MNLNWFKEKLRTFGLEYFAKYYSIYRGVVEDNNDPDKRGRLKIKVPQIFGKTVPNYWAESRGMFAGKGIGFFAIPNVGDAVWVSFEAGNPKFPVWEWGWFNKSDPPEQTQTNYPKVQVWQSTTGNRVELNDEEKVIRIVDNAGNIIELNSTGVSIVTGTRKISLGSLDGSTQKAILGDTLKTTLENLINQIAIITVPTPAGPSGPPVNAPAILAMINTLNAILSNKVTLD